MMLLIKGGWQERRQPKRRQHHKGGLLCATLPCWSAGWWLRARMRQPDEWKASACGQRTSGMVRRVWMEEPPARHPGGLVL